MPSEPRWLTAGEVAQLNRRAVEKTGEPYLILSEALLEGACDRPANRWHYGEHGIGELAGWLLVAVAQAHAFQQGNKRTGLLAAMGFLAVNGWRLESGDDLADPILAVLDHTITEEAFVALFASRCACLLQRAARRARPIRSDKQGLKMLRRYLPKK